MQLSKQNANGEMTRIMFTRRHYKLIASRLREAHDLKSLQELLIETFKADNPRFSEKLFKEAIEKA